MELEKVVQDTINNMVSSGKVTEMIEKHLTNTVDEIVKDALRSYGDFGKSIKDAVNKCLNIDLNNMKLLDLSVVINKTINEQLSQSIDKNLLKSVNETIKDITGELEKQEWKISEIIDLLKQDAEDYDKDNSEKITLITVLDNSYGKYVHYYFDYKEDKGKYECQFQLDTKDGEVYNFTGGKLSPKGNDIRFSPVFGSFEKMLFRLYASKATIINDSEDVNEYYEEYD